MAKPICKLTGQDGNVFNIIGLVKSALNKAGLKIEAEEFQDKALSASSYDEVLQLCHEYVKVR